MLNCPKCNTPIDRHPPGPCLDHWVLRATGSRRLLVAAAYSTDLHDAWRILQVTYRRFHLRVDISREHEDHGTAWCIELSRRHEPAVFTGAYSTCGDPDSAPLAICRAVVLAWAQWGPVEESVS